MHILGSIKFIVTEKQYFFIFQYGPMLKLCPMSRMTNRLISTLKVMPKILSMTLTM
jgi:hypothetical protein